MTGGLGCRAPRLRHRACACSCMHACAHRALPPPRINDAGLTASLPASPSFLAGPPRRAGQTGPFATRRLTPPIVTPAWSRPWHTLTNGQPRSTRALTRPRRARCGGCGAVFGSAGSSKLGHMPVVGQPCGQCLRLPRDLCGTQCTASLPQLGPSTPAVAHLPLQHRNPRIPAGTKISLADVTKLAGAAAVAALGGPSRYEVSLPVVNTCLMGAVHDMCCAWVLCMDAMHSMGAQHCQACPAIAPPGLHARSACAVPSRSTCPVHIPLTCPVQLTLPGYADEGISFHARSCDPL